MPSGVYTHKTGYKRPPFSKEWKKKISDAKTLKPTNYWLGKKRPEIVNFFTMKGKHHSEKTIQKMKGHKVWNEGLKGFRAGEKSHLWRGGITPINRAIRSSLEMKQWRKAVFERDNYTCVFCGDKASGKLQADHIMPFALFERVRFDLLNGRTLCEDCHRKTETYGEKTKKILIKIT